MKYFLNFIFSILLKYLYPSITAGKLRTIKNISDADINFAYLISTSSVENINNAYLDRLELSGHNLNTIKSVVLEYDSLNLGERELFWKIKENTFLFSQINSCENKDAILTIAKADYDSLYCLAQMFENIYDQNIDHYSKLEFLELNQIITDNQIEAINSWTFEDYSDSLLKLEENILINTFQYAEILELQKNQNIGNKMSLKELEADKDNENKLKEIVLLKTFNFLFFEVEVTKESEEGIFSISKSDSKLINVNKAIQIFKIKEDDGFSNVGNFIGTFRKTKYVDNYSEDRIYLEYKKNIERCVLKTVIESDGTVDIDTSILKTSYGENFLEKVFIVRTLETDTYMGEFRIPKNNFSINSCILVPTKNSKEYTKKAIKTLDIFDYFEVETEEKEEKIKHNSTKENIKKVEKIKINPLQEINL
jgi:hypothetical protein